MIMLLAFYAIMAGVFTFGKKVILHASPFFLTAIRITPAGLMFLAYQYLSDRKRFYLDKKLIPYLISFSVAIFCLDSLRLKALIYIPASNAALIACMAPFFGAFLSWWWFKERFGIKKICALIIGVTGMLPILLSHTSVPGARLSLLLFSYLAVCISTFAFVLCGILSKFIIHKKGYPFFMTVGLGMVGGGLLGLLFSLATESWNPVPIENFWPAVTLISYLFISHSLIAYPFYNYLVQHYPVSLVVFAQLSVPFFAALMGFIFYKEAIGAPFFISLILLGCSFWLFYKEEIRQGLIR